MENGMRVERKGRDKGEGHYGKLLVRGSKNKWSVRGKRGNDRRMEGEGRKMATGRRKSGKEEKEGKDKGKVTSEGRRGD